MSYPHLAARLYNTPLVITAEKLEVIERVFRMHVEGTPKLLQPYEKPAPRAEVAPAGEAQMTRAGYVRTHDGIAIVPVLGTLVHRAGPMDAESGLASYQNIGAQLSAAISDPQVRGVLMDIDSDGGEVFGIFDLAAQIRALSQHKPIIAHANEKALSGGYVLAAAANEVYTTRTGVVGSIGVRMAHVDQSKYDEKRGYVYTDIFAGARKNDFTPHEPLSDAAREWAQAHVDRTYDIFVDHVATMRDVDHESVRATEAGVFHVEEAQARGLVDGIATAGEALGIIRDRVKAGGGTRTHMRMAAQADRTFQSSAKADDTGAEDMANDQKQPAAAALTPTDLADAEVRGFQQGKAEGEKAVAAARSEGAKAAQERIKAILTHPEAEGRRTLAEHFAYETDDSVEKVAAALAKAPKEVKAAAPVNPLDAAMRATGNPQVGADTPADAGNEEESVRALAASIINAGRSGKTRTAA